MRQGDEAIISPEHAEKRGRLPIFRRFGEFILAPSADLNRTVSTA